MQLEYNCHWPDRASRRSHLVLAKRAAHYQADLALSCSQSHLKKKQVSFGFILVGLIKVICLQKTGWRTGFLFLTSKSRQVFWTGFWQGRLSDRKVEQDEKTGNRSCDRFYNIRGCCLSTLYCLETCQRFSSLSFLPVLSSCPNNDPEKKPVYRNLSRFRAQE